MAEAFGLAAGVLQVASFGAEVGSTLWRCAKKFHSASKELEEIANQVETIALSLRRVDALLQDPATKALHTPKLYEDTAAVSNGCHEVFRELDKHVKGFEAKSSFGKMTMLSKTRWLFDSDKLQGLGQALRRYNDVLHLMISVMAIVEGRRAATKDELHALEAHLQVLAISNRDLSQSNKSLTDTIAAISQAPMKPVATKTGGLHTLPTDNMHGFPGGLYATSFVAMPSVNSSATMPLHPEPCIEILRNCMQSVHELVRSMQCALSALHGYEKVGSSDVHGSYARLAASLNELPTSVQCVHCARSIALSQLGHAKKDAAQVGICSCMSQTLLSLRVQPSQQSVAMNLGSSQPQMQTNSAMPHGTSGARPNLNGVSQSLTAPDEATIELMVEKLSRAKHFQELSEHQKRQVALRLHHQNQLVAMKHNPQLQTPEGVNYNQGQQNAVTMEHTVTMQQIELHQQEHQHQRQQQQQQGQEQRHSPEQQALMKQRILQRQALIKQRILEQQQQQQQQQSQQQQLHHHPQTTVSQQSVMAAQQSWLGQQGEVFAVPQDVPQQPLSRHHGQALGAPLRTEGLTSPSTPDSQVQLRDSYYSAATSPCPPYTYDNAAYIDHNSPYAGTSSVSANLPFNGPPAIANPNQMGLTNETSSPANDYYSQIRPASRLSMPIDNTNVAKHPVSEMAPQPPPPPPMQMLPTDRQSPQPAHLSRQAGYVSGVQDSLMIPNPQQAGQKRSRSDAFPESMSHALTPPPSKRRINLNPYKASVKPESSVPTSGSALDIETHEASPSDMSAVQALLSRWVDSSTATVLLEGRYC